MTEKEKRVLWVALSLAAGVGVYLWWKSSQPAPVTAAPGQAGGGPTSAADQVAQPGTVQQSGAAVIAMPAATLVPASRAMTVNDCLTAE